MGREDELDRLRVAWKEAQAGRRRVSLLGGEPGVGKTRLAAVLAEELQGAGATVLAGRCDEDLGVPYQPVVEALRHLVDHTTDSHLVARLGRYGGELARLVPELPQRAPGLAAPLGSDPETERYRLFDAVAAWLGALSADQAVLLVLDDLQWAAKPTLLLLRHVVRSPAPMRLLVLGTYRDTELGPGHPLSELLTDLRRDDAVERLSLSGLDEAAVLAVVEQAAGHDLDQEERALVRAIHQETEGNPFFVWEVVRHLAETGAVVRRLGRWVAQRSELGIPEGVRDVVGRRLSRLSEATNGVLSSAAVVGTDFDVGVLRAVCGLDEGELVVALDEAAGARLVQETGAGAYRFVHALVRSALYDTLSATKRTRLHLRVADALGEERADDASHLARHLLACAPLGGSTRTARACLAAGDRALSMLADAEAGEWYSQGLAFAEDDPVLRIDLLTGLGEAQRRTGDAASRQTLLDASRLAAAGGDVPRLVRAVVANSHGTASPLGDIERVELIDTALDLVGPAGSAERAEILSLQAAELAVGGDHERVLRAADEAAAIAAPLDDVTLRARIGVRRVLACLVPDRVTALAAEGTDLVGWADATGDPKLRVLSRRSPPLLAAGALAEARRRTAEAMAIADETGQLELRAVATVYFVAAIDALGEHEEAERLIQVAFELGQEADFPEAMLWYVGQMVLHWIFEGQPEMVTAVAASASDAYSRVSALGAISALGLALAGRDEELAALFNGLSSVLSEMPVDFMWLSNHFLFAAAQGFGVENPETAAAVYDRLLPYRTLHAAYGVGYWGPIEVALAIAARVMGDNEGALTHHQAAAVTIEACGAARARALNGYQWAVALLSRNAPGDRQQAAEILQETLAYCRTKGYSTFVNKTQELLTTTR